MWLISFGWLQRSNNLAAALLVETSPSHLLTPKPGVDDECQTPVGVEKVRDRISFLPVMVAAAEFLLSPQLRGGFPSGCCRLAKEPH